MEMNLFSRTFSFFFKGAEKILLIEQFEDSFYVTHVVSQSDSRKLSLVRRYKVSSLESVRRPPIWMGVFDKAILALHSENATTIEGVNRIVRDKPNDPISEGELDAMLFKAFWNFLNRYRPFAAKKFNTNELDPVVANIVVCGISLGEHKVFNPLDFSGHEVSIRFRGTFVPREILNSIDRISKFANGNIFVVERGTILSGALNKENAFIDIGDTKTTIYVTSNSESAYLHEVAWGARKITNAIARYFGVDESIVPEILRRYTKNQVSEKVRRLVERITREEVNELLRLITPTFESAGLKKSSLIHYTLRARESLPQSLLDEFGFQKVEFSGEFESNGFAGSSFGDVYSARADIAHQSFILLGYPYLHPQYSFLNQLLRRRVRWLTPSTSSKN